MQVAHKAERAVVEGWEVVVQQVVDPVLHTRLLGKLLELRVPS